MPLGRNTRNFLRACRSSFLRRAEGGAASEASKPPEARGGGCRVDLVKSASKGGGKCWIRIKRYKKAQLLLQRPPHDERLSRAQSAQRTHTTPTTQKSVRVEIRKPAFGHATAVVIILRAIYIYSYKYSIVWTEQLYSCTLLNLDYRFCSSYMQTATFAAPPV